MFSKTTNIYNLLFIAFFAIILQSSCSKSSKDEIYVSDISPENGTIIYIGDPIVINVNILFSDNDLLSYQIDIYNNDSINYTTSQVKVIPFRITRTGVLKGKEAKISEIIDVTHSIEESNNRVEESNYKLNITIRDDSNNRFIITRDLTFKNK